MTRERRERENFQRQVEENCARAESADAAVAQDVEGALTVASRAERVGSVGQSVEMNGAGDEGERDDDKNRANHPREHVSEQPILTDERHAQKETDDWEPRE